MTFFSCIIHVTFRQADKIEKNKFGKIKQKNTANESKKQNQVVNDIPKSIGNVEIKLIIIFQKAHKSVMNMITDLTV